MPLWLRLQSAIVRVMSESCQVMYLAEDVKYLKKKMQRKKLTRQERHESAAHCTLHTATGDCGSSAAKCKAVNLCFQRSHYKLMVWSGRHLWTFEQQNCALNYYQKWLPVGYVADVAGKQTFSQTHFLYRKLRNRKQSQEQISSPNSTLKEKYLHLICRNNVNPQKFQCALD